MLLKEWRGRWRVSQLTGYRGDGPSAGDADEIAVPLRLEVAGTVLSFLSTVTTFGSALDPVTAGLSVETLLPLDDTTSSFLRGRA